MRQQSNARRDPMGRDRTSQGRASHPRMRWLQRHSVFDNARVPSPFPDVPMGGGRKEFLLWRETNSVCWFAVCISGPKRNRDRLTIYQELLDVGLEPVTAVHPRAWVSDTASIGLGSQVLAMAAVCAHASMGTACIVNTNATVDHDCRLGEGRAHNARSHRRR